MRLNGDQTRPNNGQSSDQITDRPDVWTRKSDDRSGDRAVDRTRVTVSEAARLLGLSAEAVRSRVQRGTLESTKIGGTVYVLLDADQTSINRSNTSGRRTNDETADQSADLSTARLLDSQQDQIDWLRREVERKDTIIMSLTQRIPELEAPVEPRDASETASEGDSGIETPARDTGEPRRSWWRRWFGFE